jgi:hypothetical protein
MVEHAIDYIETRITSPEYNLKDIWLDNVDIPGGEIGIKELTIVNCVWTVMQRFSTGGE